MNQLTKALTDVALALRENASAQRELAASQRELAEAHRAAEKLLAPPGSAASLASGFSAPAEAAYEIPDPEVGRSLRQVGKQVMTEANASLAKRDLIAYPGLGLSTVTSTDLGTQEGCCGGGCRATDADEPGEHNPDWLMNSYGLSGMGMPLPEEDDQQPLPHPDGPAADTAP